MDDIVREESVIDKALMRRVTIRVAIIGVGRLLGRQAESRHGKVRDQIELPSWSRGWVGWGRQGTRRETERAPGDPKRGGDSRLQ